MEVVVRINHKPITQQTIAQALKVIVLIKHHQLIQQTIITQVIVITIIFPQEMIHQLQGKLILALEQLPHKKLSLWERNSLL